MAFLRPTKVIIHHSLTKDSGTVSWSAIRRYHMQELGWDDIGYHYGIELVGDHYEVLVGRPENVQGAHCKQCGRNHDSLGICFIGNFDIESPSDEMLSRAVSVFSPIITRLGIDFSQIFTHNHFASYKTCPGTLFPMIRFKEALFRGSW